MEKKRDVINCFLLSLMAGISLSFGGFIFLLSENKVVGALFFTVGLFLVLTRKYNLYTGKIAYIIDKKPSYLLDLAIIWFGNLVGSVLFAVMISATRFVNVEDVAKTVSETKLSQTPLSAFVLAVLCGFIIYLAVENFNKNEHEFGKYIGLVFLIPLFVMCGFEHCVADMFYFALAGEFNPKAILYIIIITVGNSFGSILLNGLRKVVEKRKNN